MKKPLLLGLTLAVLLVGFSLWLPSLRARLADPAPAPGPVAAEPRETAPTVPSSAPSAVPTTTLAAGAGTSKPALKSLGRSRLDAQVKKVVESMDLVGRPPTGVVEGGRKGKERAVFQNFERRLPVKAAGYYRECDVWPRGTSGRGPERLVFGREAEVYYSKDHYKSFVRLR
ncbi:MAG TPA: ribonuclease domain-containing protein [Vicinamibacteria bacterium]